MEGREEKGGGGFISWEEGGRGRILSHTGKEQTNFLLSISLSPPNGPTFSPRPLFVLSAEL